ncbi:uncharacterized protein LOC143531491 [Bidens hawaiensis]|uniref:uncharacterized protein LOC143531491 n=1 Tax=Bidens hawaiensis TaxID=980011 RepID=UPI00404B89F3
MGDSDLLKMPFVLSSLGYYEWKDSMFVLWNPSIRKSVALSVPDVSDLNDGQTLIAFGVCPRTSDPKIVNINFHILSTLDDTIFSPWQVGVYTLSSRAWRSIPTVSHSRNTIQLMQNQVVVDEFIYWLAVDHRTNIRTMDLWSYMIVSFDMTRERFMEISLDLPDAIARDNVALFKLKESLVVIKAVKGAGKLVYGVWMMEHGVPNLFTKLFTINTPDASIINVLGFRANNEPIFVKRADDDAHDIFVLEIHSEHLCFGGISGNGISYHSLPYMETLLLLDH